MARKREEEERRIIESGEDCFIKLYIELRPRTCRAEHDVGHVDLLARLLGTIASKHSSERRREFCIFTDSEERSNYYLLQIDLFMGLW